MTTINYLRRDYPVLETRQLPSGLYGKINISTSDKPAYVWRLMPPADSGLLYDQPQPCRALAIWRPTIELPITELGFFKEGSKQEAIPGLLLHKSNVRIVLTLPESEAA